MQSAISEGKRIGVVKSKWWLTVFLMLPALLFGVAASEVGAQEELEAKIIFETNYTDRDTGIQIFTDGDPWRKVKIFDPDGKLIFDVKAKGYLKNFGLTELFSESNEPNWEDMSLPEIVALFPEGEYLFEGQSTEKDFLEGIAVLSHALPCAPTELSPAEDDIVSSASPVVISWEAVENMLNNDTGDCSDDEIEIEAYQVIVENLTSEKDFSVFLDDDADQVTLPPEFVTPNSAYKYEVLAIAENGNQTITEIPLFCTDAACVAPPE